MDNRALIATECQVPAAGCAAGTRARLVKGQHEGQEGQVEHRVHPRDRAVSVRLEGGPVVVALRGDVLLLPTTRSDIVAHSRQALAARHAADPGAMDRFQARMGKLAAAARREAHRVDRFVLGKPEPMPVLAKPAGMSRQEWKIERRRLLEEHRVATQTLADKWAGRQGTPETLEKLGHHTDCLQQLLLNGTIDKEQLEWAAEIANVYRSIEADVGIRGGSIEARVDNDRRAGAAVAEGIRRVRLHHAYTLWRDEIPAPKQLVLDMLVGEQVGYTVAARRHRTNAKRAKRLLIEAIDRWPGCVKLAYRAVDEKKWAELNDAA
ncbi:hypothetical protein [Rhizorhabdus sp.]|uniref:hypothetical protein n=1 Tax=Rhizorhabdus sp. TaxID=1968843 RepID=UPI0035AF98F6